MLVLQIQCQVQPYEVFEPQAHYLSVLEDIMVSHRSLQLRACRFACVSAEALRFVQSGSDAGYQECLLAVLQVAVSRCCLSSMLVARSYTVKHWSWP